MPNSCERRVSGEQDKALRFYTDVLKTLIDGNMPFLLGGTQAYERYTGVRRDTKDLDIFARRKDLDMILKYLEKQGYNTEMTFPHWLAKVHLGENFIDIIFSSANGTCPVTSLWFDHAIDSEVYGLPVKLIPVEEMIFSKAYIMEKERFDGGDINHLIRCHGDHMDWNRLLTNFDTHWRVLFSHIVMFGFVYPEEKAKCVPNWVIEELTSRMVQEQRQASTIDANNNNNYNNSNNNGEPAKRSKKICNGTLVSRAQYLTDVYKWGYGDGRLRHMSHDDIYEWTRAMPDLAKYNQKLVICRHGFQCQMNCNAGDGGQLIMKAAATATATANNSSTEERLECICSPIMLEVEKMDSNA